MAVDEEPDGGAGVVPCIALPAKVTCPAVVGKELYDLLSAMAYIILVSSSYLSKPFVKFCNKGKNSHVLM